MQTVPVVLEYRSSLSHVLARAHAQARLTPKQVIVLAGTWTIEQLTENRSIRGGQGDYRYNRENKRPIPNYRLSAGWRLVEVGA